MPDIVLNDFIYKNWMWLPAHSIPLVTWPPLLMQAYRVNMLVTCQKFSARESAWLRLFSLHYYLIVHIDFIAPFCISFFRFPYWCWWCSPGFEWWFSFMIPYLIPYSISTSSFRFWDVVCLRNVHLFSPSRTFKNLSVTVTVVICCGHMCILCQHLHGLVLAITYLSSK